MAMMVDDPGLPVSWPLSVASWATRIGIIALPALGLAAYVKRAEPRRQVRLLVAMNVLWFVGGPVAWLLVDVVSDFEDGGEWVLPFAALLPMALPLWALLLSVRAARMAGAAPAD